MLYEYIVWENDNVREDGTPKDEMIVAARDPEHAAEMFASRRYKPSEAKHFIVSVIPNNKFAPTVEDVVIADRFDICVVQRFEARWIGD